MNEKPCTVCGEVKSLEEFNRSARARDGRHTFCRPCHKRLNAEYGKRNRERLREYHRQRYAENKDTYKAKTKAWHQRNRWALWEAGYRARSAKFGFTPVVERFTREDIVARYGNACTYCGGEFQELDHYMPVSKGGSHTLDNVRPSCKPCNLSKGDADPTSQRASHSTSGVR